MQRRKYPRTSGLRQKRSVVEIGSRPKRDTLPTPPGDHPSLAGSPSRLENTHVAKMGKGVREFDWLPTPTWDDLNFHIPISKNAFEMSAEFPLFWPKIRLGDFCSCKLWSCPVLVRLFGAIATAVLVDLRRCLCRLREGPSSGSFPLCFGGCRWSQTRVLAACISRDRPQ